MTFERPFTLKTGYFARFKVIITCMRSNVYVVMALAGANETALFACDQVQVAAIFSDWIFFV